MKFWISLLLLAGCSQLLWAQERCYEDTNGRHLSKRCYVDILKKYDADSLALIHDSTPFKRIDIDVSKEKIMDSIPKGFFYFIDSYDYYRNILISKKIGRFKRKITVLNQDYTVGVNRYKNGKRSGLNEVFFQRNLYKERDHFKSGKKIGNWRYWDEKGNLIEVKKYKRGELIQTINGKRLKSPSFFQFHLSGKIETQFININNLNQTILESDISNKKITQGFGIFNFGFEIGNPSSFTLYVYGRTLDPWLNRTPIHLTANTTGGAIFVTFLQTKRINYRLGAGSEIGGFALYNDQINSNYEILSHSVINCKKAVNLDFTFQFMARRLIKNASADLDFIGFEIGYILPVKNGVFTNENKTSLNFSELPFGFSGFHFSLVLNLKEFRLRRN